MYLCFSQIHINRQVNFANFPEGSELERRIDWKAVHKVIRGFLAREVSELEVKREARYLLTSPKEIATHTKVNVKTVRKHLLGIAGRRVDGKIVITRIDRTDVIVKLAE